ncbi:tetratricopeptide repeat protein [Phenylobacterium sp.]|jgi:tetratricopeptide (TPR) repeat protein|uniref:tetratricopeptide repeat protein n=1 Tax=Phenylobacterium sp. TaxID=1871053 RepID=UPI002F91EC63
MPRPDTDAAEKSRYQRAMADESQPDDVFRRAVQLQREGRLEDAAAAYGEVARRQPDRAAAHANLGTVLWRLGRLEAALQALDAAVRLAPMEAGVHVVRGVVLRALGRPEAAAESHRRALALRPDDADALGKLGNALRDLGRPDEALGAFDRAVTLKPDDPALHNNRAGALVELGRLGDALAAHDRALALKPDFAEAHNDRGIALAGLDRLEEAVEAYRQAVALRPAFAMAWNNLGAALRRLRRYEAAISAFDQALAARPDYPEAAANRSYCLLTLGRFAEGWAGYERRWGAPDFRAECSAHVSPALQARLEPEVTGADLAGAEVLVVGEQGVGDVIMFASALPDLLRIAGRVSLIADPRLARLFAYAFPELEILPHGADPGARRVVAIGSLGRLFRHKWQDFPGTPYLQAPPEARARWADRRGPRGGVRRIGISWRGGTPKTGGAARSVALEALSPVLDLPGCEIVSLQYGDVPAEVAAAAERLGRSIRLFPRAEIDDFAELAALIAHMDLVVSVQNTTVHLAGALGAPCLGLVPASPEWRYLDAGERMPWYGSVQLIRQEVPGEWARAIAEAARVARERLAEA